MNELVRRGKLKRDQIDNSPYKQFKNAVTRAVGVYASVEVDTFDFDILPGDRFLGAIPVIDQLSDGSSSSLLDFGEAQTIGAESYRALAASIEFASPA